MRRSLYKYYSERRWAEAFLQGAVLFRSLSYFRDCEDENVRRDQNEGTAIYCPEEGLIVSNLTQGKQFVLQHHSFESRARQQEIFVFCASTLLSEELRKRFDAIVCVEICRIGAFCDRVKAALPLQAKFFGRRVEYYHQAEGGTPRWALPEVIATSKLENYSWQSEYRFVFSLTDALDFEKVEIQLTPEGNQKVANLSDHHEYLVKTSDLHDICRLREF
jgi:hypothetical protein